MTDSKELIAKLRKAYKEKGFSYDKILSMMEVDDAYSSKATLSRLFGKNWEQYEFNYDRTLIPIANVLLDFEAEENDDDDTKALKSLLRLKMSVIDENAQQIKELKAEVKEISSKERSKYAERLEKETVKFQQSLDFAMKQIELKDKRIDQLMDANDRLSVTNNRLLEQFLECPLKQKECKE